MPTYIYRCPSCGKEIEKAHGMSEKPTILCPECGEKAQREITGGVGFIVKGGDSRASCCGIDSPCEDPKRCCQN